ncbi:MAG: proprotein convertase P-domain-containing protein [Bacteroidota bacterium]|nr:proprotein convertase P-domain-containing protein [Bacteroidota bacterium]
MKTRLIIFLILNSLFLLLNSSRAQMFWNQACQFAGTNTSYVSAPNSSSINITGSFTLEAWVYPFYYNGFSKGVISKGGSLGAGKNYAMRLQSTGRFDVWTRGVLRLTSNNTCPVNQWTHIAAVYNASNNTFGLYFNGVSDNSVAIANANPLSNTETLFIGIAGINTPFAGNVDEVRIWNRALSPNEVNQNRRMQLGTQGGLYENLKLSYTFQTEISSIPKFTLYDRSLNYNTGVNNGVTGVDLGEVPSEMISFNQCVKLGSAGDYLAGVDVLAISPTTGTTLQAWIYPLDNVTDQVIIHKGAPSGGASTNYSLNMIGRKLAAKINGNIYDSQDTLKVNQWSHVAFTYTFDGLRRYYSFYVNGKKVRSSSIMSIANSQIVDGTDSLYIGGGVTTMQGFFGYLDEVRISTYAKTQTDILDTLFSPMEHKPPYPGATASYTLDGSTWCNTYWGPPLYFRGTAQFSYASASFIFPETPLNKSTFLNFQKGFYTKSAVRNIPQSGTVGSMTDDTLDILLDETINDINVYVGLNHNAIGELDVYIITPQNISVKLTDNNTLIAPMHHMATVFDDQATKPIANNTYTTFSPSVRPVNSLSALHGMNSKGKWRLAVVDESGVNTGKLYAWGLRINNKFTLPALLSNNCLIQGFYNPNTNSMVSDTVKSYLRNTFAPYAILDSSKAVLQSNGSVSFSFTSGTIIKGIFYFLELNHRNSIKTWNTFPYVVFDALTSQAYYDFTTDSTRAFGNNMIQVDNSPVEFAIYNGDVNQDGIIDINDNQLIGNDAFNFAAGYLKTDVNGDGAIDLADAAIADNNAFNFVSVVRP